MTCNYNDIIMPLYTENNSEHKEDVERFVKAHTNMYPVALSEIKNGRKESHWIWYVFPQLRGLGRSYNSDYYGLKGIAEARLYMANPVLRTHMTEIITELLKLPTSNAVQIFGILDAMKFRSSLTLFNIAFPDDIFAHALDKFFNGQQDQRTIAMLSNTD